jgi:poly(beta-D-mannuronate) lyase
MGIYMEIKNIMKTSISLSTLLMILVLQLYGNEYRVSTATQVSTIMTTAVPGDTLTMVQGTWTNANILFVGFGRADAPILLRAESLGGVTLTGTSNLRISGRHLIVDGLVFSNGNSPSGAVVEFRGSNGESDSCRLTNCSITDFNPTDSMKDYKWVSLYGTHNRVDHCYFKGKKHIGTTLVVWVDSTKANYHLIDRNYFAYRPVFPVNGAETIRVGTSDVSLHDSYTTVENNYFEECNGEIEIISSKSCGNIYRYNTFVSCQGTLTLRHGNRCEVYGNWFFCNDALNSGGIRIIGEDHKVYNNYIEKTAGSSMKSGIIMMNGVPNSPLNRYFQVKRALVVFNTLVDNKYSFYIGAGKDTELTLPPIDCVIANNLVWSNHSPLITYYDTPTNMKYEGNIFYGATLGITPQPSGIKIANPALVYGTGTDSLWRITGTSIAIDSAIGSYPFVTEDMDGQPRTIPYDVGADEYSTISITRRPLKRVDVGPQTGTTSVHEMLNSRPGRFKLEQNYPNPFNPATQIRFSFANEGIAKLKVYNIIGQQVATLFEGTAVAGMLYERTFHASGMSSGPYFARLESAGQVQVQKLILTK